MKILTLGLLKCTQCGSRELVLRERKDEREIRSIDVEGVKTTKALKEIPKGIIVCENCSFYYTIGVQGPGILDASPIYFRNPKEEKCILEEWGFSTENLRFEMPQLNEREKWLLGRFKEVMKAYESPGEC